MEYSDDSIYFKLKERFHENSLFSTDYTQEEFDTKWKALNQKLVCVIGHGNQDDGIKINFSNGSFNYLTAKDFNGFDQLKCVALLGCAYENLIDPDLPKYVLIADNDMGPRQQEAFLSIFLTLITKGYKLKPAFLLTEYALSLYYYSHEGTKLYWKDDVVYEVL